MESLEKVLEFVGKYSWAVFVMVAFVLFIPDDAAKQLGFIDIRNQYKGLWWLGLVLTGALWLGAVFSYLHKKVFDGWLEGRRERNKREPGLRRRKENIRLRLGSLDDREQLWFKYCMLNNIQTLSAQLDNATAQSLVNKQLLSQGSGSMLNLPFHVPDDVWKLLREEGADFLSAEEINDPKFRQVLEEFHNSLHPRIW